MSCRPLLSRRFLLTAAPRRLFSTALPFPTIQTCPDPTCQCPPTPDLDIDHEKSLSGLVGPYKQHLVVATGQPDWTSRIENDQNCGSLTVGVKRGLRRDPYNNILITYSSFQGSEGHSPVANSNIGAPKAASALLFPSRTYIPRIPTSSLSDIETFVRAFLLPTALHDAHSVLPESTRASMGRDPELQSKFGDVVDISEEVIVLICGHGGRDMRCGIMGPLLKTVFEDVLVKTGFDLIPDGKPFATLKGATARARVGLISHIGGHKFAGNVIIYMPSRLSEGGKMETESGKDTLLGKAIWYGRIEPKHVEGLVDETIVKGRVIEDLCRGVVGERGELFRPPVTGNMLQRRSS